MPGWAHPTGACLRLLKMGESRLEARHPSTKRVPPAKTGVASGARCRLPRAYPAASRQPGARPDGSARCPPAVPRPGQVTGTDVCGSVGALIHGVSTGRGGGAISTGGARPGDTTGNPCSCRAGAGMTGTGFLARARPRPTGASCGVYGGRAGFSWSDGVGMTGSGRVSRSPPEGPMRVRRPDAASSRWRARRSRARRLSRVPRAAAGASSAEGSVHRAPRGAIGAGTDTSGDLRGLPGPAAGAGARGLRGDASRPCAGVHAARGFPCPAAAGPAGGGLAPDAGIEQRTADRHVETGPRWFAPRASRRRGCEEQDEERVQQQRQDDELGERWPRLGPPGVSGHPGRGRRGSRRREAAEGKFREFGGLPNQEHIASAPRGAARPAARASTRPRPRSSGGRKPSARATRNRATRGPSRGSGRAAASCRRRANARSSRLLRGRRGDRAMDHTGDARIPVGIRKDRYPRARRDQREGWSRALAGFLRNARGKAGPGCTAHHVVRRGRNRSRAERG